MTDLIAADVAGHRSQLEANREHAAELCARLTAQQIGWRPGPDRWSVTECLQHLAVSAREYSANILAAARAGRERGLLAPTPPPYSWLMRRVIREMGPPVRSRQRSPRKFLPPGERLEPEAVRALVEERARIWHRCLDESEGLDLGRVKVRSPAVPLLRFRLGALFAIITAHERRHLWQAEEVCGSPGFPGERP